MSCFFVTGTDTNVGKTTASRAIIQALQNKGIKTVGYKPIACTHEEMIQRNAILPEKTDYDSKENIDVLTLINSSNEKLSYTEANSYTFNYTLPILLAEKNRVDLGKIDRALAQLVSKYQSVVVEGSFGLLTPMDEKKSFADWILMHKMPALLVVGIKDGCINHALLTALALKTLGIPLLGWIANRINPFLGHYAEVIDILKTHINAPLIGKIPYIHKPEEQELGQYLTNIELLL